MLSRIMGISDQERQILDLLPEGWAIKEIAEKMRISIEVVKLSGGKWSVTCCGLTG